MLEVLWKLSPHQKDLQLRVRHLLFLKFLDIEGFAVNLLQQRLDLNYS
jgi:hypothetical protein